MKIGARKIMNNREANEPIALPVSVSGRPAIDVALEAAGVAGAILAERFRTEVDVKIKGRGNIVTDVDVATENAVIATLLREYPGMSILGEESGGSPVDEGWVWIIDPLDGTRNFASGVPHFSTVVALAHNGVVHVGVNHDPLREETFHAVRGEGSFLNGRRITVSEGTRLEEGILGLDLSYIDDGAADQLRLVLELWPGMQTARILGSAALGLAYVAAGRFHVFFHHKLEPWDQAAGLLLVEEAGGIVTDRNGCSAGLHSDGTVAASHALHQEFMRLTAKMPWRMRRA
jgi:fructose-1,6-bisphosphatase/inositol monophosphatase family enzyme